MKKRALWLGVLFLWSPVLVSLPDLSDAFGQPLGSRQIGLLATTLAYAICVGAAATAIGLLVALGVAERPLGLRRQMRIVCLVACALPGVVVSGAAMGLTDRLSPSLSQGWLSAWATHSGLLAPFATLAILASLSCLPQDAIDAAAVLCRPSRAFVGVVWPLVRSTVFTVAALCAVMAATDYGVPSLFGADTYPLEVFADVSAGRPALASAWPLLLPALAFGAFAGPWLADRAKPSSASPVPRLWLPGTLSLGASVASALVLIAILGIIVSLAAQIPDWRDAWVAIVRARGDLATTTVVALLTGLASALLGLAVGPGLAESRGRAAWTLLLASFAFPATLVGTAVADLGLFRSAPELFPTVLAHVLRFGGLAAVAVAIGWNRLPRDAVDSARVFVTPTKRALRLYPILLSPFVLYGFLIATILSVGELGATLMTIAPGRSTATIRLYNALHYGASDDAAAIGLCLCFAVAFPFAIGAFVKRRWAI